MRHISSQLTVSVKNFFSALKKSDANSASQNIDAQAAILSEGSNASIAYFLVPYLAAAGKAQTILQLSDQPPRRIGAGGCETLVIARYLRKNWIKPIREFAQDGGQVIYFMDDDLMDPAATLGLPTLYAKKIAAKATCYKGFLEEVCDEFWVSSRYLAEKYQVWSPRVIAPQPLLSTKNLESNIAICYHGTGSHLLEIRWLFDILSRVQKHLGNTHFEIFGDHAVNKIYRTLPRSTVLHPMSWENYLRFSSSVHRDIALAPLLPNQFNAARGPTKFFDFTRMGAVGIYTDIPPYRGFIRDGIDGFLVPNNADAWVETIIAVSQDLERLQKMARAAQERVSEMVGITIPKTDP